MLDIRRDMMRPAARLVPLPLHNQARKILIIVRARGLTPADVIAASFPKAGSTWLRFMIADLTVQGGAADFATIARLSPPLGQHHAAPRLIEDHGRFIKTHESFSAFTRFPARALYVVRDGRDVAVSMYHYLRRRGVYSGPFDDYLDAFLAGRVVNYGSWQDHVRAWLSAVAQHPERIAVLRYEDLLQAGGAETLQGTLAKIGWAVPIEAARAAVERNSLDSMRLKESRTDVSVWRMKDASSSPAVPFVRAGRAEQWKEQFTENQMQRFRAKAGSALQLAGYPTG
jgi:hypothetical protein